MATLRLFANLRESAGTGSAEIPGGTVGEVLTNAARRFGPDFERGLGSAAVWVNGEAASAEDPVGDGDEVAAIPPVSGGTSVVRSPAAMEFGLVGALTIALFISNALSLQWLVVTIVLAGGVWAYDLSDFAARRGTPIGAIALMAGILGSALATYRFGIPGTAAAVAGAALFSLVWSVLNPRLRPIEAVAATTAAAITGAFGTGAFVLLRLRSEEEVFAYLTVATVSVLATWAAGSAQIPAIDPLVAGMGAAVAAGVGAALAWGDTVAPILLASVGAAFALVAGRNLGSLLRSGGFFLASPVPGSLHFFDGVMMAAGPFWLILSLLT
jgi:molybdopterin converting factor small subunit